MFPDISVCFPLASSFVKSVLAWHHLPFCRAFSDTNEKNAHFLRGFLKETQEKLSEFPNFSQTWLVVFSPISLAPSRGQAGIEAWCWDFFGCKHRLLQHTSFRQGAAPLTPYRKGKEIGMMRQRQQYVPYEMPCCWISLPFGLSDNGLATAAAQQSTAGLTIFWITLTGLWREDIPMFLSKWSEFWLMMLSLDSRQK